MISDGKIFGINAQIDFGNFAVGLATLGVAAVSFLVALWSKKHDERRAIAGLREAWVQDLRTHLPEFIAESQKVRTAARLKINFDERQDFYIENIAKSRILKTYIEMKLNKNDIHKKIFFIYGKKNKKIQLIFGI